MNKPTPTECIELLDRATARLNMTREEHVSCQLAVRTITAVISDYSAMKATQVAAAAESEVAEG